MVPLLLLSIVVLSIGVERIRYWRRWLTGRKRQERQLIETLQRTPSGAQRQMVETLELGQIDASMAQGEAVLEAATLIGPLIGLIGTVTGLMKVLASLGPQFSLPSGATVVGYGQVLVSTWMGLVIALIAVVILRANQGVRQGQRRHLERLCLSGILDSP